MKRLIVIYLITKHHVMKKESSLHNAVARYIAMQYPNAIFNSDLSGIRLTMGQSMQVKKLRSSNSFPDMVIYQPRVDQSDTRFIQYMALFIELKERGRKITRRDGYLVADKRLRDQNEMLLALERQGYCARFGHGFDKTKELIDWYMAMNASDPTPCPVRKYVYPPAVDHPKLPLK